MTRLFSMQRSSTAKKIVLVAFLAVFLFFCFSHSVFAQDAFGVNDASGAGLPEQTDLKLVISNIVRIILGFLGIVAVLIIMYGGFIWMTAGGDPAKVEKAKKILVDAVIGLIIILSAFIIVSFIINAFKGSTTGRGQGAPGVSSDLSRWGIGGGPIESVYPAPNQIDVPINTVVVVTFKELIDPASICDSDSGACEGQQMRNVEICQLNADNICVDEDNDDTNDQFGKDAFEGSTVFSRDNKTFTFTPSKYLGLEDFQDRRFMVTLQSGIEAQAQPGESIFSSLSGNQFAWSFTTNGELDLDPPELIDRAGVYPYPDDLKDDYNVTAAPTPATFTLSVNADSPVINEQFNSSYSQPVGDAGTSATASLSGVYGGEFSGQVSITIDSGTGVARTIWPDGTAIVDDNYEAGRSLSIYIGSYGLSLNLSQSAERGSRWTFNVQPYKEGDKIQVKDNNEILSEYDLGTDIIVNENIISNIVQKVVYDYSTIFSNCGSNCIQTRSTGSTVNRYSIVFIDQDDINSISISRQSGQNTRQERGVKGVFDAYRNSVFQINFNEAINPSFIDSVVISYDSNNDGVADRVIDDVRFEISNQYRTIEILPSEDYICGVNSCGDNIYCWPMYDSLGDGDDSTRYQISIVASSLMTAEDTRCAQWEGGQSTDGSQRCYKQINGVDVFYPASNQTTDGIVDMCSNSFNGSSDYYYDGARRQGLAQGQSQTGVGHSGRPAYFLNEGLIFSGGALISYGTSTPIYSVSGFGDNFTWEFWLSSEIDTQAPLAKTIFPRGEQQITDPEQRVETRFDRLMRSATLKPGWNYGQTKKDKSKRYLILDTLTKGANPVGYWSSKSDEDLNGDGWADYTMAYISHHDFDDYIKYGPAGGSGIESITQNCFIPAGGPQDAGSGECIYISDDETSGCVRDESLGGSQVKLPNPASYGYLNCSQINGASECPNQDNTCKVMYYEAALAETDLPGSWLITNDHNSAYDTDYEFGRTDCCFGVCAPIINSASCENIAGAEACSDEEVCKDKDYDSADQATNIPGIWILTKDYSSMPSGEVGPGCCAGVCVAE